MQKRHDRLLRHIPIHPTRKGPAQARVSTDIFHDGVRRETCSDVRITLAQYPNILAVHSVHFANFLRGILRCGMILNI